MAGSCVLAALVASVDGVQCAEESAEECVEPVLSNVDVVLCYAC